MKSPKLNLLIMVSKPFALECMLSDSSKEAVNSQKLEMMASMYAAASRTNRRRSFGGMMPS